MLFHISEESNIERFVPRASESFSEPVVWAVDANRLRNYLLPRECPRVTFYAGRETTKVDTECFLGTSSAVIAIESGWLERVRSCRLFCYHLPPDSFECIDEYAGYFVSSSAVVPMFVEIFDDLIAELLKRDVELRFTSNLWYLHDAIAKSTLRFSMIRMRNALPRTA